MKMARILAGRNPSAARKAPVRRMLGFLKNTLLGTFFCGLTLTCLTATPARAQMLVKFPATKPFTADEVILRAKLYKPSGSGKFPAVVLMHGCGGWQPSVEYSLQTHANYLVRHGYAVLSVDSFGPRNNGGGKVCESNRKLTDALDYRLHDAFDALHYLQQQAFIDASNVFLMGQSNGGSVAILAAKESAARTYNGDRPGFRAIAAYYPWCGPLRSNTKLESPLVVFGGEQDDWVPPDQCVSAHVTGADYQVQVYPNAVHSFDLEIMKQRYNGKLVGYDKAATLDSRAKMLAFFDNHLTVKHTRVAMRQ